MAINKQYITAIENRATDKFTGNIRQIFLYLLTTYKKLSPSQLNNFEREVTEIHYDPINPVDIIFNKVEDLIKYADILKCPYSHPQVIPKAYIINNKTGKFWESIKYCNCLPLAQKTWIAFKNHFCKAHLELTKNEELTLEQADYSQTNIVEDIVICLHTEFQHHENMEKSV